MRVHEGVTSAERSRAAVIRKAAFRIASVCTGFAVAFLIIELFLVLFHVEYDGANTSRYYTNYRGYFDRIAYDKNGRPFYWTEELATPEGYRLAYRNEQPRLPADGARSVLLLGDSFTFGKGVKYSDTYSTRLKVQLEQKGADLAIRNCGIRGAGLDKVIETYRNEAAKAHYDLVVYGFVLNDFPFPDEAGIRGDDFIDQDNNVSSEYDRWEARLRVLHFIRQAYRRMILNRRTIRQYLGAYRGDGADYSFNRLREFRGLVASNGQELVVMIFPLLYGFRDYPFQEIHDRLHAFLVQEEIPYLDLLPAFRSHSARDLWVHPVDHHPNDVAHQIAADQLQSFLVTEYGSSMFERP